MWLLLRDYFLNYLLRFPSIRKPREQVEAVKNTEVVQAANVKSLCKVRRYLYSLRNKWTLSLAYFRPGLSLDRYEKMIDYVSNARVAKKKWANPDLATMSPDVHVCSFRAATFAKVHRSISGSLSI